MLSLHGLQTARISTQVEEGRVLASRARTGAVGVDSCLLYRRRPRLTDDSPRLDDGPGGLRGIPHVVIEC